MNIHIVLVAHSLAADLLRLQKSADLPEVTWHLFLHSRYDDVREACATFQRNAPNRVRFYDYGVNRGLAKSWNEGLRNAYGQGADVVFIANDDVIMGEGDLERLAKAALKNRKKYFVTGYGFDIRHQVHVNQLFCMGAVNPVALEKVGYFDENFFPVYFEDIDWYRRATLVGLDALMVRETCIIHAGSKTAHATDAMMTQNQLTFPLNHAYYVRKWGGEIGKETFSHPFNDESLPLYISADQCAAPYGAAYDRVDQGVVTV